MEHCIIYFDLECSSRGLFIKENAKNIFGIIGQNLKFENSKKNITFLPQNLKSVYWSGVSAYLKAKEKFLLYFFENICFCFNKTFSYFSLHSLTVWNKLNLIGKSQKKNKKIERKKFFKSIK